MKRLKLIKIINIVSIVVFIVAVFNIGKIYYDYNKAESGYEDLQNEYIVIEHTAPSDANNSVSESDTKIDFDALLERNKDTVGWLYCPSSVINYPVLKGKDNNQYLRRDLDGKYLITGTLFVDYRPNPNNYIIYGHNMKNSTMFSMLTKYKTQTFYDKHPIMYYYTPDNDYKLEIVAGLTVKSNDRIYDPTLTKDEFMKMIREYTAASTFNSGIELTDTDKIVTLSTCSYEFDNARYIVIGKLVKN